MVFADLGSAAVNSGVRLANELFDTQVRIVSKCDELECVVTENY